MQGTFVHGSRPKTKKELKETVKGIYEIDPEPGSSHIHDPYCVVIEATSIFGNEFDGSLAQAEKEDRLGPFYVVGPDPSTSRKWYAEVKFNRSTNRWEVK